MEQNETGCQASPEAPALCANNCGFFGSAATMNLCSKCYKDLMLKEEQAKLAATSIENIVNGGSSSKRKDPEPAVAVHNKFTTSLDTYVSVETSVTTETNQNNENVKKGPKRCGACNKRVGLTGFDCRCGNVFCATHRYSDKHECQFDYRTAGRDAIAKANPVVKAEKLEKI